MKEKMEDKELVELYKQELKKLWKVIYSCGDWYEWIDTDDDGRPFPGAKKICENMTVAYDNKDHPSQLKDTLLGLRMEAIAEYEKEAEELFGSDYDSVPSIPLMVQHHILKNGI